MSQVGCEHFQRYNGLMVNGDCPSDKGEWSRVMVQSPGTSKIHLDDFVLARRTHDCHFQLTRCSSSSCSILSFSCFKASAVSSFSDSFSFKVSCRASILFLASSSASWSFILASCRSFARFASCSFE